MRLPFHSLGLALLAAAPALAQTTPPAPNTPRYYVGLAAYTSFYQPIGHPTAPYYSNFIRSSSFRLPVQLTAGYYISPRVAVQVGLAYSTGTSQYYQTYVYNSSTPATPSPFNSTEGTSRQTQVAASVLGRYTLTANPAHRLQFDALGGFTFEHSNFRTQGYYSDGSSGTAVSTPYDNTFARNTLLLTGGVGTRYRLGSRLALIYDFTVNKALNNEAAPYGSNVLTTRHALGLRDQFGR